jgi:hypothetical protein
MASKPLVFVETEDESPAEKPKSKIQRQITFYKNLCRPLWQDGNPHQPMNNKLGVDKEKNVIPKVISKLDSPVCGRNGTCSECQLSREIEESYQSEKDKCGQQ